MTRNKSVIFHPSPVQSLVDPEDLPPFINLSDGGKRQVVPIYGFQPPGILPNGWRPECRYTALLLLDNEWNPLVAPYGNAGSWAVIGGMNWPEAAMVATERGSVPMSPDLRIWTFGGNNRREVELCELMRLYFQRQRLKQAKLGSLIMPDLNENRIANLSSEEFMNEAIEYQALVHQIWQTV